MKNQLKGNMLLGLETSDSRMSRIAKNEIYFGRDDSARGGRGAASTRPPTTRSCASAQRLFRPGSAGGHGARRSEGRALGDELLAG